MEKLDITIAESHSADFEEGTWTFQPSEDFVVRAGTYVIIHKPDLDKHVQDISIAFAKWKNGLILKDRMKTVFDNGEPCYAPKEYSELFTDFISQYNK